MVSQSLEIPLSQSYWNGFCYRKASHIEKQSQLRSSSFFVEVELATANISDFSPAKYFLGSVQS